MRTLDLAGARRLAVGLAAAGLLSVAVVGGVAAQDGGVDTANSGGGGSSTANANGGAVEMGSVDSGSTSGAAINIADILANAIAAGEDDIAQAVIDAILGGQ